MKIVKILEHSFFAEPLASATLILDCGANRGGFSQWASRNTPATIHAFEPDPSLNTVLPVTPRVVIHPFAVDGVSGSMELAQGVSNCSSGVYRESAAQKVVTVEKKALDEFWIENGKGAIDLLKLDIEGAELTLLPKVTEEFLVACTQITVEFHDFLQIEDRSQILAIRDRLCSLGFSYIRFSHFTWGDCLFFNATKLGLSARNIAWLKIRYKYFRGLGRLIRRKLD